jgi:hypothetical protein
MSLGSRLTGGRFLYSQGKAQWASRAARAVTCWLRRDNRSVNAITFASAKYGNINNRCCQPWQGTIIGRITRSIAFPY